MTALPYEIAKLLKEPENRLCADCQSPLTTPPNIHASLRYGVWLCSTCAEIHHSELLHSSFMKKAQESWSSDEINIMQKAKSNVTVNKIFERYIPTGWQKLQPSSSMEERRHWIKAKYFSHYFTLPQASLDGINKKIESNRKKRIIVDTTLPTRIADYFLILGPGQAKELGTNVDEPITNLEQIEFRVDIIDSYPAKNSYPDTPIPELVGPMVFPSGLTLSKNERAPFSFSFVLTDINRVKLYGMTLIIYELMDPDTLQFLLGLKYASTNIKSLTNGMVYYAPKALTILSHYGFFQLFDKFLQQIYHVSLSTSPLPIERYIVNFMKELPLPPQGRTEILYSLPEMQLSLTRPPKNLLPMVDFSYRPLFACLSVENILTVFTCLCLEMTICVTSRNIALLTPVQEALLSFLFPFVWQGCYVPILPIQMIEMLDAPVPLLAGINQAELETLEDYAPSSNVILVNLDQDTVSYGLGAENPLDEPPRPILPLPKAKVAKLRAKLEEFGGCIHHQDPVLVMKAGYPFSNNEHLIPIKSFLFEQGMIASTTKRGSSMFSTAKALAKSQLKLGIRKSHVHSPDSTSGSVSTAASLSPPMTKSNSNTTKRASLLSPSFGNYQSMSEAEAIPFKHPAACTLVVSHSPSATASSSSSSSSILDAENNYLPGQAFNAKEIREAFLRFFVASFMDYGDFFIDQKKGGVKVNPLSFPSTDVIPWEDYDFDKKGFIDHVQDDFLAHMVNSQMFSNFLSEKMDSKHATSIEIHFFDENILAKKNRSKFQLIKASTPFLSDTKDYLREIYTVPIPSTYGIPENATYTYPAFPSRWTMAHFGQTIRTAIILVEAPEKSRLQDNEQANTYLWAMLNNNNNNSNTTPTTMGDGNYQSLKKLNKQLSERMKKVALTGSSPSPLPTEATTTTTTGSSAEETNDSSAPRYITLSRQMSGYMNKPLALTGLAAADGDISAANTTTPLSPTALQMHLSVEEMRFFQLTRQYYYYLLNQVMALQAMFRGRQDYLRYRHYRRAVQCLQIAFRYRRMRQLRQNRVFITAILKLQSSYRRYCQYRRYLLFRYAVVSLQSFYRSRRQRSRYLYLRSRIIRIQAKLRGWRQSKLFQQMVREARKERQEQISLLWVIERTSYYYRSLFWKKIIASQSDTQQQCLLLSFYDEECRRLYESLGMTQSDSPWYIPHFQSSSSSSSSSSFQQQFQRVNQLPMIVKLGTMMKGFVLQSRPTTISTSAPSWQTMMVKNDSNQIKQTIAQINQTLLSYYQQKGGVWWTWYQTALEQEKKNQEYLYSLFQQYEKTTTTTNTATTSSNEGWRLEDCYGFFQIEQRKRRKRKMTQYLFYGSLSRDYQELSSQIVLRLLHFAHHNNSNRNQQSSTATATATATSSMQKEQLAMTKTMSLQWYVSEEEWFSLKKQQLLMKHCFEVMKACLLAMERLRRKTRKMRNDQEQR